MSKTIMPSSTHLPAVDIFILNYNRSHFIRETLASVLSQTYAGPKRVIFSDDGSTDNSVKIAQEFCASHGIEIHIRNPRSGGCFRHYNLVLREVQAPYFGVFHCEDIYNPSIIEKQITLFQKAPTLDAVLTGAVAIDEMGQKAWPLPLPPNIQFPVLDSKQVYEFILKHGNSFLICPSALYRTSAFQSLGEFRGEFLNADVEMWFRILLKGGGLGYINEPLMRYRLSTGSITSLYERSRKELSELFQIADEYLIEFPPSKEIQSAYEALRHLDLFIAGLNRLADGESPELMLKHLDWLTQSENQKMMGNFGSIDRLKVCGARVFLIPWARSTLGPRLARLLIRRTHPKHSWILKMALQFKRRQLVQ